MNTAEGFDFVLILHFAYWFCIQNRSVPFKTVSTDCTQSGVFLYSDADTRKIEKLPCQTEYVNEFCSCIVVCRCRHLRIILLRVVRINQRSCRGRGLRRKVCSTLVSATTEPFFCWHRIPTYCIRSKHSTTRPRMQLRWGKTAESYILPLG